MGFLGFGKSRQRPAPSVEREPVYMAEPPQRFDTSSAQLEEILSHRKITAVVRFLAVGTMFLLPLFNHLPPTDNNLIFFQGSVLVGANFLSWLIEGSTGFKRTRLSHPNGSSMDKLIGQTEHLALDAMALASAERWTMPQQMTPFEGLMVFSALAAYSLHTYRKFSKKL